MDFSSIPYTSFVAGLPLLSLVAVFGLNFSGHSQLHKAPRARHSSLLHRKTEHPIQPPLDAGLCSFALALRVSQAWDQADYSRNS